MSTTNAEASRSTSYEVLRTATHFAERARGEREDSRPLIDWRQAEAYVLLGDPGAGKTTAFRQEAHATGGVQLEASDIVDGIAPSIPSGGVVFIDGLDQVQAGLKEGRTALGAIRAWLHSQNRPRFRISCREADWHGDNELKLLHQLSPSGEVLALHLDPLTPQQVRDIACHRQAEIGDIAAFLDKAEQLGMDTLFSNALLLDLAIKSRLLSEGEHWCKRDIYENACIALLDEHNRTHAQFSQLRTQTRDKVLHQVGLLFAVLLLSQKTVVSLFEQGASLVLIPGQLPGDIGLDLSLVEASLGSKLFTAVKDGFTYRHRTLAEYLAAKALAQCIEAGLPSGRVLAMMQGFDGQPVEPLKGLFGWLAVHSTNLRPQFVRCDPVAILRNGDASSFTSHERTALLDALFDLCRQGTGFLDADLGRSLAAVLRVDLQADLLSRLENLGRGEAEQAFHWLLMRGLAHADRMPVLAEVLVQAVMNQRLSMDNRLAAYRAWKRHRVDQDGSMLPMKWLEEAVSSLNLQDNERLAGTLLKDLYPEVIASERVFDYFKPRRQWVFSDYAYFWIHDLFTQTPAQELPTLADAWVRRRPIDRDDHEDDDERRLSAELLARVIEHHGEQAPLDRLVAWLGMCIDRHGISRADDKHRQVIAGWLAAHPNRMKEVVASGWQKAVASGEGAKRFWSVEQYLHGAKLPADWWHWLLALAGGTTDEDLAKYLLVQVAWARLHLSGDPSVPSLEDIEQWVDRNDHRWPKARDWLLEVWWSKLEKGNWQQEDHQRARRHKARQEIEKEERRKSFAKVLPLLSHGQAPIGWLHDIAVAHDRGFLNIQGDSPRERLRHLLVTDEEGVEAALEAIDHVLTRDDLPTADAILNLADQKRRYLLAPAALLAARRAHERDPSACLDWPQSLVQTLVAFCLNDGAGECAGWYEVLARERTTWVAAILIRYARPRLKSKEAQYVAGLSGLSEGAGQAELAREVLPVLLAGFPTRASEGARQLLNRTLLPGLRFLDRTSAVALIRKKLDLKSLEPLQRISWQVAALAYDPQAVQELLDEVGSNPRRVQSLGEVLEHQREATLLGDSLAVDVVSRLVELLAPMTPRGARVEGGWFTDEMRREETLVAFLRRLGTAATTEARDALQRLNELPGMGAWRSEIERQIEQQRAALRASLYRVPLAGAVARALANGTPASSADLLALAIENLRTLQGELRGTDIFPLRRYWQDTKDAKERKPFDEGRCRDELVDALRQRLRPLKVDVTTESRVAQDKRPDIWLSHLGNGHRFALPVEVKKEDNGKLWTAWQEQLEQLYTIHPDAAGYGLYLVLWFGVHPKAHPDGLKPHSARQLCQMLQDRMPESARLQIKVFVLDLSWPPAISTP